MTLPLSFRAKSRNLPSSLFPTTFRSIGAELGIHVEVFEGRLVTWSPRWRQALSPDSAFCKALVANDILTEPQMLRAVLRYRLGCSRSGGVIFWQINQQEETYDGKIMYYRPDCHRDKNHNPNWVSAILTKRYGWEKGTTRHCFFGLHQLSNSPFGYTDAVKIIDERYEPICHPEPAEGPLCHSERSRGISEISPCASLSRDDKAIAIVEAEKTAVIMSEIYPQYIWLAAGGLGEVQTDKFRPLRGRKLILFPDTDPKGIAFKRWSDAAALVQQQLFWENSPPIYVSDILERKSTPDQKSRKIDIADYYLETIKPQLLIQK